ncbi:unnamed protein product [Fraxinus pennsylvanica]|uniref:Myb-like domain-containing protein n=1 Tax=Fraxinus pennsylvanica TaxID=56036 RepID=A0AAD2DII2_9LAMI|nr:unnamed protein product [Fraxinus pennsylvanica]
MEIDTSSKENQILSRNICGEGFPVGFSSFSTLSRRSLEGPSNPFSKFSAPSDDPFHPNQLSTQSAEGSVKAQIKMHGLQPRRFLDLNSEGSLQTMDQCQINEPLNLKSCLVFDSKLERRTDLNNKTKKSNVIKAQWTLEEDRERWHNHLKPDIKKDKWSEEEDMRLIEAHKELGNRWSQIARRLSESLGNSSLPSISSNGTLVNSMQREQIEMKSESDARKEEQFDMQKQMDFMEMLSSSYV